jgi:hypothetical protein
MAVCLQGNLMFTLQPRFNELKGINVNFPNNPPLDAGAARKQSSVLQELQAVTDHMQEAVMMRREDDERKMILLNRYMEEMVELERELGPFNVPDGYEEKLSALEELVRNM